MAYCSKCGSTIPEAAKFCPECGTSIKQEKTLAPKISTPPKIVKSNIVDRMIRAASLDPSVYEEVEADENATTQALLVVIISSMCSGIGTGINEALIGNGVKAISIGLFAGVGSAFIGWLIWSFITYFVGTRIFGGNASFGELLRTIGFADSPRVLLIISFIPILGGLISLGVWIWGLVAMVVAVRQGLDFSLGKAILTCIVGWIVAIISIAIIGIAFAIPFFLLGL